MLGIRRVVDAVQATARQVHSTHHATQAANLRAIRVSRQPWACLRLLLLGLFWLAFGDCGNQEFCEGWGFGVPGIWLLDLVPTENNVSFHFPPSIPSSTACPRCQCRRHISILSPENGSIQGPSKDRSIWIVSFPRLRWSDCRPQKAPLSSVEPYQESRSAPSLSTCRKSGRQALLIVPKMCRRTQYTTSYSALLFD